MAFINRLENVLTKFGKNTSPTAVVVGIAIAKGIFRPMFTMMDKHESYETKRYTAFREGLTELIAIPVYWGSGVATKYLAGKLAQPRFFMKKDLFKAYKEGKITPEVDKAYKSAEKLAKENLPKLATNLSFVGVCASALLFIPLICSATIKPIMDKIDSGKPKKKEQEQISPSFEQKYIPLTANSPYHKTFSSFNSASYGMKVGGV